MFLTTEDFDRLSTPTITYEESSVLFSHQHAPSMTLPDVAVQNIVCIRNGHITPILLFAHHQEMNVMKMDGRYHEARLAEVYDLPIEKGDDALHTLRTYLVEESSLRLKWLLHDWTMA